MSEQPVVSIIVPVYNAQKYLERCLNSILNQSYPFFEIVIVDDGSVDDSLSICEEFARIDSRIKVIHQANKGPSAARNVGLQQICGEYLCCVDADDTISENMLETLVTRMEESQADVCIFSWRFLYEDGTIKQYCFSDEEMVTSMEKIFPMIMQGAYRCGGGNPWNKIWRIATLKENQGISLFDESILIFEDMLWTLQNLKKCETIIFENNCLYDYYILKNSISRSGNDVQRRRLYFLGAKRVYEYICENQKNAEEQACFWFRRITYVYIKEKYVNGVPVTEEEKKIIKQLPWGYRGFSTYFQWMKFLFIRLAVCK